MPGEPAPSNLLYGLVGVGMRAHIRASFRFRLLGAKNARLRPGMLIVATHRSDHDVPAIASLLYLEGGAWRGPARMHFASRDDLFERGALAGMAPGLPGPLARVLWRATPAGGLARARVHPLGRADLAAPAQALRSVDPATPLERVLPADVMERIAERAAARGIAPPRTASDALRAEFAGILFTACGLEDLGSPLLRDFWRARGRDAATHLRRLADLVRAGAPLVVFPEGGLSSDGGIGPLRRGFGVLARMARPSSVLPVALAYDGLTTGRRPHLIVAVGSTFVPAPREEEAEVLRVLRSLMPLTCGQLVAHTIVAACRRGETRIGTADLARRLDAAIERANHDARPVDPLLGAAASRSRRLVDAAEALVRRGVVRTPGGGGLDLDHAAAAQDALIQRLATEYDSAREAG